MTSKPLPTPLYGHRSTEAALERVAAAFAGRANVRTLMLIEIGPFLRHMAAMAKEA
jgi:hypothetical protein